MKKFLLFFLFTSIVCNSQQKEYKLNWGEKQIWSAGNFSLEIPSFNTNYFSYDFEESLQFVDYWTITNPINEASIVVTNVSYSNISKSELGDLDINKLPKELVFSLKNSQSRDKQYAFFSLSPILKSEDGTFKKVMSFQIAYNEASNANKLAVTSKALGA